MDAQTQVKLQARFRAHGHAAATAGAFTRRHHAALGEFRKASSSALTEAKIMEIDKDLTNHPIDKIEKIVVKALEDAKA